MQKYIINGKFGGIALLFEPSAWPMKMTVKSLPPNISSICNKCTEFEVLADRPGRRETREGGETYPLSSPHRRYARKWRAPINAALLCAELNKNDKEWQNYIVASKKWSYDTKLGCC